SEKFIQNNIKKSLHPTIYYVGNKRFVYDFSI
ncbi:MAG: hypothetical protein RLZZ414_1117, partial [Bacteroidota bacterium]